MYIAPYIASESEALKYVATLPCQMFVLKTSHVSRLSGANCHA